jgi:hypothetical protein
MKILEIREKEYNNYVYNIEVEENHNYFANNILVHNCHEGSSVQGKHGDLEELSGVLSMLPGGQELAIGGGDALSHPDLIPFLQRCKEQGLICNITVNQKQLDRDVATLRRLIGDKLVYGIGLSVTNPILWSEDELWFADYEHTVCHLIIGVHTVDDVKTLKQFGFKKFLLLGYKVFGRGVDYYLKNGKIIDNNISKWEEHILKLFKGCIISFDNLSIEQLKLKDKLPQKLWDVSYMGQEFHHTMYIDTVEKEFAPTSRSPLSERVKWNHTDLLEYFQTNRNRD